jgi:ribosomal protein S18 acetylase RimI-like enzyme
MLSARERPGQTEVSLITAMTLIIDPPFRRATPDDAPHLARFVNMAGDGMPRYLWERMAGPGESAWDIGCARAKREAGAFSWRNTILRMSGDEPVACLIGYPLEDHPAPADYASMPPMFEPLQRLEDQVPGTWYINVLATQPSHRGKGYGRELLTLAGHIAASLGKRGTSLIVSDANAGARRLYADLGYREMAQRPMVKEQWDHAGSNWVLLGKYPGAAV